VGVVFTPTKEKQTRHRIFLPPKQVGRTDPIRDYTKKGGTKEVIRVKQQDSRRILNNHRGVRATTTSWEGEY